MKKVKVIYNPFHQTYAVYHKKLLFWKLSKTFVIHQNYPDSVAKADAILYAKSFLNTTTIFIA